MNKKYLLTIDQGTTSTRAILFNKKGNIVLSVQEPTKCSYPKPNYVEQDALEIWLSVISVVNKLLVKANIKLEDIDSVGITNQRETTVVWDKKTGLPVYPAIVWQSRQSLDYCLELEDKKDLIFNKTGLKINPYFSASKIRFILDHIKNGQKRAENGELMFGTIDSWIIYKLTNHQVHATDVSNASRTLLFNIFEMKWDEELLSLFNIPKIILPQVKPSSHLFGHTTFFKVNLPITGVAGDQQAALFGHLCLEVGDAKNTYGTGCFMLMNIGEKPFLTEGGILTTVAWQIGDKVIYALEGSVFVAGAAVQWLRDDMGLISTSEQSEIEAMKVENSGNVYVVPAFTGLGTPYWDDKARGAVFGLTRATTKQHFIRATLEAIAYQSKDVFHSMSKHSGFDVNNLKVDGGASNNKYLMQFQADILASNISIPRILETTSLGVCYLAGLYTGFFENIEEIRKIHRYEKVYKANMEEIRRVKLYLGWKKAVRATRSFE